MSDTQRNALEKKYTDAYLTKRYNTTCRAHVKEEFETRDASGKKLPPGWKRRHRLNYKGDTGSSRPVKSITYYYVNGKKSQDHSPCDPLPAGAKRCFDTEKVGWERAYIVNSDGKFMSWW